VWINDWKFLWEKFLKTLRSCGQFAASFCQNCSAKVAVFFGPKSMQFPSPQRLAKKACIQALWWRDFSSSPSLLSFGAQTEPKILLADAIFDR
jgi:hypothetical protein